MHAIHETTQQLKAALAHAEHLLIREPVLAADQAREILRVMPNQPDAEILLARALRAQGFANDALTLINAVVTRFPRAAIAHHERGNILAKLKQGDAALGAHRVAVQIEPRLAESWRAIADHLRAQDDEQGAEAAVNQYLLHAHTDARLRDAASALNEGQLPQAERLLKQFLYQYPTDVAAIRMLAELASRLGRYEDAENLLRRCLELAPGFHAARQNLAMVLHRSNQPDAALIEIDALLKLDSHNPSARNLKAVVQCRIGDYEPAIQTYTEILDEYPQHPKLWLSYGHALKTAGHQARAITAYRQCIVLDPLCGEAFWSLANLKTFRFDEKDKQAMFLALQNSQLEAEQRSQFEFALGKAFEDEQDFVQSFAHYDQGNTIRRANFSYSADEATVRVARAKKMFTRDFFAERADCGWAANDPIFIVGLPRSGSTLIEQILSSHSQVEGTMELPELISMTRDLRRQMLLGDEASYHDVLARLSADDLKKLGEQYLNNTRIHRKTDAPFFIDKMPNNFFHIGLIQLILPKAKIIDARRHPMACCFSGFKQYFARGQNFSYGQTDLARYYRDYVDLMAHYDQVLPERVHRVFYERMVEDTETQVRALLDYCRLPFEQNCLKFFENARPVRTASSEQVRQPIYKEGLDQWKNFEIMLEPMAQSLGDVLRQYPELPDHLNNNLPE